MSESCVDNSEWWAYVRYKSGKKTAFVPILSIKEKKAGHKKKVLFNPQNLTDFKTNQFYSVKTTEDSVDGQLHYWYANIGKLGESYESLHKEVTEGRKRIKWPVLDENDSEAISTAVEELLESNVTNPDVLKNRQENRQIKKQKKCATDTLHTNLLYNISSQWSQPSHSSQTSNSEGADSDASCLRKEREEVKSQLKDKDELLQTLRRLETDTVLLQHIKDLTETIKRQHADTNKRIEMLENKIDMFVRKSDKSIDYVVAWLTHIPDSVLAYREG